MSIYISEDEQVQKIKNWIKENGIVVILGIAIFFVASFGWRYWQQHQNRRNIQASNLYEQVIAARVASKYDDVKLYAQHLRDNHGSSVYASLASLVSAREATVQKDWTTAERDLLWIIDYAKSTDFKQITRIRLARIYIENKKSDKALEVLKIVDNKTYLANIHETRGDVYLSVGDKKLALQEYQKATELAENDSLTKSMVEMKLNQVAAIIAQKNVL